MFNTNYFVEHLDLADRVFDNGALQYSYFPGGYFDADGAPHYLHTDYQGSVVMVTDSAGTIEAPPSIGQCRTTRDYNLN